MLTDLVLWNAAVAVRVIETAAEIDVATEARNEGRITEAVHDMLALLR